MGITDSQRDALRRIESEEGSIDCIPLRTAKALLRRHYVLEVWGKKSAVRYAITPTGERALRA